MNPRISPNETPFVDVTEFGTSGVSGKLGGTLADTTGVEQEELTMRAAHLRQMVNDLAASHGPGTDAVCEIAVEVCKVDCSAVLIGRGESRGALHTTDRTAASMEDLQITVGEGPCVDAWETRGPVLTPDLDEPEVADRWPGFASLARAAGVRAVFAFPLQVGAVRLGTLSLYRGQPGGLGQDETRDALLLSGIAVDQLLTLSEGAGTSGPQEIGVGEDSLKIYQATGMVAAQLGVGVEEAFARLRGRAFSEGRPLSHVAGGVLDGTEAFTAAEEGNHGSPPSAEHDEDR
ncbi:GAF and ANTAR domain-containing protein [Streptomyces sp. MUM 136J]|uniref:GAF and ANTAR domain-containing protein n=1 Tax=Streptomyces sp. MUM 136J TaxID=2791992 RepID=UPI001F046AB4|nr:GAF and ANTAR domain-containing protein [Streptomyces sp. MUM 136J]MCH0572397.1 GAF and ANTAR domain-containing protein [Streptomyces sp. MUM 136J]